MRDPQHRDLAAGRWWDLPLVEQLGHVGSEISRADPRLRSSRPRLREIARAREVVADYFAGPNQYGSTGASLQKYFNACALAARRRAADDRTS